MSALVRKFLLGANYIWRCKELRDAREEELVVPETPDASVDKSVPVTPAKSPLEHVTHVNEQFLSPHTSLALQRARALWQRNSTPEVPRKRRSSVFIDQSPGGISDAIHIATTEHHSRFDAASRPDSIVDRLSVKTEDVEEASREAPDNVAVISPLTDGRLVDQAK